MDVLDFWGSIPRLVPKFLRAPGYDPHVIPSHFRPSCRPGRDPYAGGDAGKRPRTDLEVELDHVQACLVADLDCIVQALAAVERREQTDKNRKTAPKTLEDVLTAAAPGPSSFDTLLRKGRRSIRERHETCDPAYRGYLKPTMAKRLAAANDTQRLEGLIAAHVTAINLVGRARNAAQATAEGLRATFIEVEKNKRRHDETISRDILDRLPGLSIREAACLSFVSGVNASHIWQYHHGAPETIDYHRVFDLAVFAGRLSRGEPAPITWDLARYLELHHDDPNINRSWRVTLFPNTGEVHLALEWICARIEDICSFDTLKDMLGRCNQPGQSGTLRRAPFTP